MKSHHRIISRRFNYFKGYPIWPYPSFMWDVLTNHNLVLDDFLAKKIKEHAFYRVLSFILILLCVLGFFVLMP